MSKKAKTLFLAILLSLIVCVPAGAAEDDSSVSGLWTYFVEWVDQVVESLTDEENDDQAPDYFPVVDPEG